MLITQADDDHVRIGDGMIPAVNIQVSGFPKMEKHDDHPSQHVSLYPIYFETPVGDEWWVVFTYGDGIVLETYPKGDHDTLLERHTWAEWFGFIILYTQKAYGKS